MRMRMWMWLTMTSDEDTANMMLLDAVRSSRTHQILKHDDDASTDRSRPWDSPTAQRSCSDSVSSKTMTVNQYHRYHDYLPLERNLSDILERRKLALNPTPSPVASLSHRHCPTISAHNSMFPSSNVMKSHYPPVRHRLTSQPVVFTVTEFKPTPTPIRTNALGL